VLNQVPHHKDPWEVLPHLNFEVLHVTKSLEWSAIKKQFAQAKYFTDFSEKGNTYEPSIFMDESICMYVCVYKEKVGTTQVQHTKYTLC